MDELLRSNGAAVILIVETEHGCQGLQLLFRKHLRRRHPPPRPRPVHVLAPTAHEPQVLWA
eukprot:CAMPEP_0115304498 /NCGR_PEP_ID=MMETSP0270-20121206/71498_1 /TAXON_ID=71861 /ORGANISM="Scrippsiella trochoidea, Strain CCMP3099" /LENGTH=60 /DNA_ID=CAMNT_0002722595 /DNA_START=71 /DNA_END=253 /DNA_ORIENTATION=-